MLASLFVFGFAEEVRVRLLLILGDWRRRLVGDLLEERARSTKGLAADSWASFHRSISSSRSPVVAVPSAASALFSCPVDMFAALAALSLRAGLTERTTAGDPFDLRDGL